MPSAVTLRPARAADAPSLCAVHARAIRALTGTHCTALQRDAWVARLGPPGMREAIAARTVVVAEIAAPEGPRVAGYGQLHPAEGAIEAVYVDPDFARRGVGTALVEALERAARAQGLPGLVVEASLNSVAFYRALGFRQEGLDRHELAPGVPVAFAVMEKRFGSDAR